MRTIEIETYKELEKRGVEKPNYPFASEFTELTFILKDPIDNSILKEYKMLKSEYDKLDYEDKKGYKQLDKTEVFDEKAHLKAEREYNKKLNEYEATYYTIYNEVLTDAGITIEEDKKVKAIIDIFHDDLDLYDRYGSQADQTIIDLEDSVLREIKK